jgi:hypothetical protein
MNLKSSRQTFVITDNFMFPFHHPKTFKRQMATFLFTIGTIYLIPIVVLFGDFIVHGFHGFRRGLQRISRFLELIHSEHFYSSSPLMLIEIKLRVPNGIQYVAPTRRSLSASHDHACWYRLPHACAE